MTERDAARDGAAAVGAGSSSRPSPVESIVGKFVGTGRVPDGGTAVVIAALAVADAGEVAREIVGRSSHRPPKTASCRECGSVVS